MGTAKSASAADADTRVIAPLVGDYYDWLIGKGGRSVEEILETVKLTQAQRRLLLERCDDVLVCRGVAAHSRTKAVLKSRTASGGSAAGC